MPPQLNWQLDPHQYRIGFSQNITDFNAWAQSDPGFAAGWQDIQGQITAEGTASAGQLVSSAQQTIYDSAGNVVQQGLYGAASAAGGAAQGILNQGGGLLNQAGGLLQQGEQAVGGALQQGQQAVQGAVSQTSSDVIASINQKLNIAKISYVGEYEAVLQNGLNEVVTDPVKAAKDFVIAGNTIVGALKNVEGLVSLFQQNASFETEVQIGSAFCGVMISIATAAGAVSAGLGAIIVGLIGAAISLMQQAGLLKTTSSIPPSKEICGGVFVDETANLPVSADSSGGVTTRSVPLAFIVGCVAAYTDTPQISPGAKNWRSFPRYTAPVPMDRAIDPTEASKYGPDLLWFGNISYNGPGVGPWKNAVWYTGHTQSGDWANPGKRPIDIAFSVYRYLECEMSQPNVTDFQKAFFAAWKANKEYELNGLQSQPDYVVLLHLVRLWNQSHTNEVAIAYTNKASDLIQPILGQCDTTKPPYFQTLIGATFNLLGSSDPGVLELHNQLQSVTPGQDSASQQNALLVHGGKKITVPTTIGGSSTASTVGHVVAATAAVGAIGVFAYSRVTGVAVGTVLRDIWGVVKTPVAKFIRRA